MTMDRAGNHDLAWKWTLWQYITSKCQAKSSLKSSASKNNHFHKIIIIKTIYNNLKTNAIENHVVKYLQKLTTSKYHSLLESSIFLLSWLIRIHPVQIKPPNSWRQVSVIHILRWLISVILIDPIVNSINCLLQEVTKDYLINQQNPNKKYLKTTRLNQ